MASLNVEKVLVWPSPGGLKADTVYYVRAGAGFDTYLTNHAGTVVAYTPNSDPSALINDSAPSPTTVYSSQKTEALLAGASPAGVPSSQRDILFLSPVRGPNGTGPNVGQGQDVSFFPNLMNAYRRNGLKATWPARYDAVQDATMGAQLLQLQREGHEIAAWLEIMPDLATAAGVTYSTAGSGYASAARILLIGYAQADRKKLIDAHMAAHLARFGAYPTTVHAFMMDAYSVNYCRDTYGAKCVVLVREQSALDAYDVTGYPQNALYEGAGQHPIQPARGSDRSGMLTIRGISTDLLNSYGSGTAVYTLEPVALSTSLNTEASAYFTPLLTDQLSHPASGNVAVVFTETGWVWSQTGARIEDALRQAAGLALQGYAQVSLCRDVAAAFLARPQAVRDAGSVLWQSVDPLGGKSRVLQVATPWYSARLRYQEGVADGYLGLTDLRAYPASPVDPYRDTPMNGDYGAWVAPWTVFGAEYGGDLAGGNRRIAHDTPDSAPTRLQSFYYDPPSSTIKGDFSSPTANAAITLRSLPESGTVLYDRYAGTGRIEYRQKGLVWYLESTAQSSSSLLYLNQQVRPTVAPCTEYVYDGAGEHSLHVTGTNANTEYSGVQWYAVVQDGTDAACIFVPTDLVNGVGYAQTADDSQGLTSFRVGVAASGAGRTSVQLVIVPCQKATWRATLAAVLADPLGYLGASLTPAVLPQALQQGGGAAAPPANTALASNAKVYNAGNQSISGASWTHIQNASEDHDPENAFASGTYAAPVAGIYLVEARTVVENGASGDYNNMALWTGGVGSGSAIAKLAEDTRTVSGTYALGGCAVVALSAGQTLAAGIYLNPGRTLVSGAGATYMSVTRLG